MHERENGVIKKVIYSLQSAKPNKRRKSTHSFRGLQSLLFWNLGIKIKNNPSPAHPLNILPHFQVRIMLDVNRRKWHLTKIKIGQYKLNYLKTTDSVYCKKKKKSSHFNKEKIGKLHCRFVSRKVLLNQWLPFFFFVTYKQGRGKVRTEPFSQLTLPWTILHSLLIFIMFFVLWV